LPLYSILRHAELRKIIRCNWDAMQIPDTIKTERVFIRPFQDEDLSAYLEFMTDEEATRYLLLEPSQKTEACARALFEFVKLSYTTEEPIWALAVATEAGGFIGSCGISPIDETVFECYFSLLPKYWGQGYATEATRALLDYLFRNIPLAEVRAYVSPLNLKSAGVAERVGMKCLGIQTHPGFGKEGVLYAVTKEEWEELRNPQPHL
jgi:ribosomal-protein-alanine N-acetyltransferase